MVTIRPLESFFVPRRTMNWWSMYALAGMNQKLFVSKYQLELPSKQEMEQFIRQNRAELEQGDEKRFMEIQ